MLKSELIKELSLRLSIPYMRAETYLNGLIKMIYELTSRGEEVNISGFGKFKVTYKKQSVISNPKNVNQRMISRPSAIPKFKSGEAFKEAIKLNEQSMLE